MAETFSTYDLNYGDAPLWSRTYLSWPKYGRVGGIFVGAGGGIGRQKLPFTDKDESRIDLRDALLREDRELIDIIVMMLQKGII